MIVLENNQLMTLASLFRTEARAIKIGNFFFDSRKIGKTTFRKQPKQSASLAFCYQVNSGSE
jgi:hypothetical protein